QDSGGLGARSFQLLFLAVHRQALLPQNLFTAARSGSRPRGPGPRPGAAIRARTLVWLHRPRSRPPPRRGPPPRWPLPGPDAGWAPKRRSRGASAGAPYRPPPPATQRRPLAPGGAV